MPPVTLNAVVARTVVIDIPGRATLRANAALVESWAEGFMVGALVMMTLIVLCNIRHGIWLHKLILLELFLAMGHGTFIFCADPVYGWYLSATATLLFCSYQLHNVISWMKIKYFLPRWGSLLFIGTVIAVIPYWVAEAWTNFEYFNGLGNNSNVYTRPWEALARDPWWIFTTCRLIYTIKTSYNYRFWSLIRDSPRFGILIVCMFLSIVFLITDIIISAPKIATISGINPYWRLALVFKCAADTIFLDDFKSVLDIVVTNALKKAGGAVSNNSAKTSIPPRPRPHPTERSRKAASSDELELTSSNHASVSAQQHAQPSKARLAWERRLFSNSARPGSPDPAGRLEIRREITIATTHGRAKRLSGGSGGSADRILPQQGPAHMRAERDDGI